MGIMGVMGVMGTALRIHHSAPGLSFFFNHQFCQAAASCSIFW